MKRPLMPGFLKKAEQKLLIHKPGLWSTRIHLVLYYGILFMALLALICFLDPIDVRRRTWAEIWIGYTSIVSVIALVVWLIFLLRFNVFKKYGIIHPLYSLVTFVLYFVATVCIVLFTYVQMGVESARANMAFDDEEIVRDINDMNIKLCQLENANLQMPWEKDTLLVLPDSIAELREQIANSYYEDPDNRAILVSTRSSFTIVGETSMEHRKDGADSLITINDSMYVEYDTPPFAFVNEYDADKYTQLKTLTDFQLYHRAVKPAPPADKAAIEKELRALFSKYIIAEDTLYLSQDMIIDKDDSEFEAIRKKYRVSFVNWSIGHLTEKKYRWEPDHLPIYIRIVYYIALGISVLVFMFRNSTVKTFFLSLLTAVLLTIFTSLFLAYSGSSETGFFMTLILYTLLFFIGSLTSWLTKKRNVLAGIATNLFVLLVPIFPLICAAWYYALKRAQSMDDPELPYYTVPDSYWLIAEWSGAGLFLILLATYIHRVYRRWYSLPEE